MVILSHLMIEKIHFKDGLFSKHCQRYTLSTDSIQLWWLRWSLALEADHQRWTATMPSLYLNTNNICYHFCINWESNDSVVECLARDRGPRVRASPASLRCGPWARHIYPSLVLVQARKTRPCLAERLLMGHKESNRTNKQNKLLHKYTAIYTCLTRLISCSLSFSQR